MAMHHGGTEGVAIAVMARAPHAGAAKTRLIPALGAVGAARLQRRFTLQALGEAQRAATGTVTLWATPDCHHRFFRALQRCGHVELRSQSGGDLGERMAAVFSVSPGPVVLIGTDCPALLASHLIAAARALRADGRGQHDAVFVPAEDGGYVLVGLRAPQPRLFEGIEWGSERVMAQTRQRLRALALRWVELPTLWDVDRPGDLARLARLEGYRAWRP